MTCGKTIIQITSSPHECFTTSKVFQVNVSLTLGSKGSTRHSLTGTIHPCYPFPLLCKNWSNLLSCPNTVLIGQPSTPNDYLPRTCVIPVRTEWLAGHHSLAAIVLHLAIVLLQLVLGLTQDLMQSHKSVSAQLINFKRFLRSSLLLIIQAHSS